MSYRNEFLEAFCAKKKFLPNARPEKAFSYKDLVSFNEKKDFDCFKEAYQIMEDLFDTYYVPGRVKNNLPIAHACYCVAYDMIQWMVQNKYCDLKDMALTIGNVSFHDKFLYDISEESLKQTIDAGVDLNCDVNVHAWITYRTNYILDPTILFTLHDWKLYDLDSNPYRIHAWNESNEDMRWELNYKPMLVDSDFPSRVDKMQMKSLI